uniref:ATP-binding cassette sub-family B member 6 n=1 Tax=Phallusia mammillata TaxID=59560 RepID=A0A6F9D4W8_9ASCI|nr:ATP-binding cassette sub-family B member 6, mitochondrial [Phallusia mammillata]
MLFLSFFIYFQAFRYKRNGSHRRLQYVSCWKVRFQSVLILLMLTETFIRHGIVFGTQNVTVVGLINLFVRAAVLLGCLCLLFLEQRLFWNSQATDTIQLVSWSCFVINEILCIVSWNSEEWWFINSSSSDQVQLGFWISRLCISLLLLSSKFFNQKIKRKKPENFESGSNEKYGHGKLSTWHDFWKKIRFLFPFMWPTKDVVLQIKLVLCVALLIVGRVINPYVPIYYKTIINTLTKEPSWQMVCKQAAIYIAIKCLQGSGISGGILHGLRLFFSIKVEQYTTRTVQVKLFKHLQSLSLQWHLNRKTGEVMESMQRGTASITTLLYTFLFQMLPSLCDIIIAIVYFTSAFDVWFGMLISAWIILYLVATVWIIEWKTKFQRAQNLKDNRAKHVAYDALLNFETVKCYNTEEYETLKFRDAIVDYQNSQYWTSATLVLLNMVQMVIVHAGLLGGTLLCGKYVLDGKLQIADFILFETYMAQLYHPLGTLGHYYRLIQNSFIDLENMLDLFNEKIGIVDEPDAISLSGEADLLEFKDVCFNYSPQKPVLKNVSFKMKSGQTFALVGASGCGKSTITRLLLRFFNATSGTIKMNGINIQKLLQSSIRNCVGLVPQDCVLFNDSIMSNITYGMKVTEEQINYAAVLAGIHHQVLGMPDQYATDVGERGLNLSGGERQRLAIARTILKNPSVVLLDEPTSALDNKAASEIRKTISQLNKGRASLIVTHRLAMAVDADCILVLENGEIVERGRHEDLICANGVYARMWRQQLDDVLADSNLMKLDLCANETVGSKKTL